MTRHRSIVLTAVALMGIGGAFASAQIVVTDPDGYKGYTTMVPATIEQSLGPPQIGQVV